jgi:hypothetical protein
MPSVGFIMKNHSTPASAGRHGIGPDQEGAVGVAVRITRLAATASASAMPIDITVTDEAEDERGPEAAQVAGIVEEPGEIFEANEIARKAEDVFQIKRGLQRLVGGPDEEDERDQRSAAPPEA